MDLLSSIDWKSGLPLDISFAAVCNGLSVPPIFWDG